MIIYHAALCEEEFILWGETPEDRAVPVSLRHGRRASASEAMPFPYDAGGKEIESCFAGAFCAPKTSASRRARAPVRYAWLPTAETGPLPSSPLIAETATAGDVILAPWAIAVRVLRDREIVDLLAACGGRQILAPGWIVGADLAWWCHALRFAGILVARQLYLPGVSESGGIYRSRWIPVLQAEDSEKMARLAAAMPAAARAVSADATAPPQTSPAALLRRFVERMVDALVRLGVPAAYSVPAPTASRRDRQKPDFDSVHDQWIHSLQSDDPTMSSEGEELQRFAAQAREWHLPVSISASSPFRLCFRLEEPPEEGGEEDIAGSGGREAWQVRYLLQAVDDRSLLVEARDAWKTRKPVEAVFRARAFEPRQFLLSALGQAAGICPHVEQSLKRPAPPGYELDTAGAHEFLALRAQALEQAGFGVMLPAWWTRKGTKLQIAARARVKSPAMQAAAGLSLNQIVRFDVDLALGGEPITIAELEALAALKAPLVRLRGQWVELNAGEIKAALDFWKKKASGTASVREIVQMALGGEKSLGGLLFHGVSAEGWIADLLARLEGQAQFEEAAAPAGFQGELRPYQVRGYSWLAFLKQWGLGACLADDMGLGKTIQALALIQRDWESNGRQPVLLICPTSVVGNWQKEAARFCPDLPVLVHHGGARVKGEAFQKIAGRHAIVVSSYALLHRDLEFLQAVPWAGVILDEAQNIKNPETRQARAARSLPAGYRVAMTGTPVENNVGDLWSVMEYLNPGFLGSREDFRRKFFVPIQALRDADAAERLKRLTAPFVLRRLKTDRSIIADLPEKMEMKVFCMLTREQASLYKAVAAEAEQAMESAEGIQRKGLILATLSKLKQVCNHPAQFLGDNSAIEGRSGKLARLAEMLEEILEVGDRALVFSQFSEMGEILRRHLQETFGQEVLFLHGAVPKKRRDEMVERFQDVKGPRIFVLSLKAGGTGLNLTSANHVFHFDRWWNPAVENQATDRAFRIGQRRNVQVHKFLCAGTLEEKIDEMIESKKDIAAKVVGTGEGWLTELSTRELKELFALRGEAIGD
jgi:SNF2 family DNA or RNA helicase